MLELKILVYWIIISLVTYVIARIDHKMSRSVIRFKYYDSFSSGIFGFFFYLGLFVLCFYIFAQFTNLFFKGSLIEW